MFRNNKEIKEIKEITTNATSFFRTQPLTMLALPFLKYLSPLPSFLFQHFLSILDSYLHLHATSSCPNPIIQLSFD